MPIQCRVFFFFVLRLCLLFTFQSDFIYYAINCFWICAVKVRNAKLRNYLNPRANGAKRRSRRKPGARVTNSARLFTPGKKRVSGVKSPSMIAGASLYIWFGVEEGNIRSGRGKDEKKTCKKTLGVKTDVR